MYISQMGLLILPTYMHSYLVGLEIFLSLPSLHTRLPLDYETTCIEDFRRPASRSRIEQKFISGCASALCDVNPRLSNTYFMSNHFNFVQVSLSLKAPAKKNASENVICSSRLLHILTNVGKQCGPNRHYKCRLLIAFANKLYPDQVR